MTTLRFMAVKNKTPKKESMSMAKAKGKCDKCFSNELFGAVDDFFYEFGFSTKPIPKNNDSQENNDSQQ